MKSSIVAILSLAVAVCHAFSDAHGETSRACQEASDDEKVESVLRHSGEAVRAAKRPEDLDDVLRELSELQRRNYANKISATEDYAQQISGALEFVRRWQEYLIELGGGDPKRAREILERLSSSGVDPGWIPRSQILRRMRGPLESQGEEITKAINEIVGRIKGLDDLDGAISELEKLKPERGYGLSRGEPSIYAILEAFAPLNNIYRDFKAGLPAPLHIPERQERGFEEPLRRLRAELIILMLPRTLELPAQVHANPGEGPVDFLRRIAAEAVAKNNYFLAARARAAEETIVGVGSSPDLAGSRDQGAFFVRGNNQEEAGQFALAVASYHAALATGGDLIPAKVIGTRLSAINAAHPAEFQNGTNLFLSPPPVSFKALNYTQPIGPNPLEIFPKLQAPTPFPPPPRRIDMVPNQSIRPVPLTPPKQTGPSPSLTK